MDLFDHLKLTFNLEEGKIQTETSAKDVRGQPYYQHLFDLNDGAKVGIESLVTPEPVQAPQVPAAKPVQVVKPAPSPTLTPAQVPAPSIQPAPAQQTNPGYPQQVQTWQQIAGTPPPGTDPTAFYAAQRQAIADYYAKLYAPATPQVQQPDAQIDAIKNIFGVTLADTEVSPSEVTLLTVEEQREIALKVVFGIFATLAAGLLIAFIHNQLQEANPKPSQQRQVTRHQQQEFIVEEINAVGQVDQEAQ